MGNNIKQCFDEFVSVVNYIGRYTCILVKLQINIPERLKIYSLSS